MAAQTRFERTLTRLGFTPVGMWRTSLVPLRTVELSKGQHDLDEVGSLEDMFDARPALPTPIPASALNFSQEASNGFSLGINATAQLFGELGKDVGAQARAAGADRLVFFFQDSSIDMVSVDQLVKVLASANVNKDVYQRILDIGVIRCVIVRSLKAGKIVMEAQNSKGAKLDLHANVPKVSTVGSVGGELDAEGRIAYSNPEGKPLVFGADCYTLVLQDGKVKVGKRLAESHGILGAISSSFSRGGGGGGHHVLRK